MEPLDDGVRQRMQRQRTADTEPELRVRRLVHAAGLRYRIDRRPISAIRSRADMVFGPAKVAVYVDGCFWHGCPEHGTLPKNNRDRWLEKLEANRARDSRVDRQLTDAGWISLRFWEHEDPIVVADRIVGVVRRRVEENVSPKG